VFDIVQFLNDLLNILVVCCELFLHSTDKTRIFSPFNFTPTSLTMTNTNVVFFYFLVFKLSSNRLGSQ
jgi:hypothetical protein